MSLDLHVYAPRSVSAQQLAAVAAEVRELRLVGDVDRAPAVLAIERRVRGEFEPAGSLDGPFVCEIDDLPDAVIASAVGITVMYHLTVRASPKQAFRDAGKLARALASACGGVVFDAQQDAVTWPRSSGRAFKPPPADTIDVVTYSWYVRRQDAPPGVAESLVELFESTFPEAMPRRFGGFEPLPHKYADIGLRGFADAWRHSALMLFWDTTRPCFGGSASGLGNEIVGPPRQHPVGKVSLTFDRRVFDLDPWRHDLVTLFTAVAETTNAFCAVGEVVTDLLHSRGRIYHTRQTGEGWGGKLDQRHEWHGLPPQDPWLLWLGPAYRRFLALDDPDADQHDGLIRRSDHPTESHNEKHHRRTSPRSRARRAQPPIPPGARMRIVNDPRHSVSDRQRANDIPPGL